jgi:hypothetical protein
MDGKKLALNNRPKQRAKLLIAQGIKKFPIQCICFITRDLKQFHILKVK